MDICERNEQIFSIGLTAHHWTLKYGPQVMIIDILTLIQNNFTFIPTLTFQNVPSVYS